MWWLYLYALIKYAFSKSVIGYTHISAYFKTLGFALILKASTVTHPMLKFNVSEKLCVVSFSTLLHLFVNNLFMYVFKGGGYQQYTRYHQYHNIAP